MLPAVSVIIPTLDSGRYISGTLASVRAQTFTDLEIVVVDSGSSDDTVDLVSRAAAEDDRIRLVRSSGRRPPPVNRNVGLGEVRAPIVALLDADDQMSPDRLERQVTALAADPGLAIVGGRLVVVDELGVSMGYPLGVGPEVRTDVPIRFTLAFGSPTVSSGMCLRTDVLRAAGGFVESSPWADDYALCERLLAVGRMAMVAEPVGVYRLHPDQGSARRKDAQVLEVALLRQRVVADVLGRTPALSTILAWSLAVNEMRDDRRRQALADLEEFHEVFARSHAMSDAEAATVRGQFERRRSQLVDHIGLDGHAA